MNYLPYFLPLAVATPLFALLGMIFFSCLGERVTRALAIAGFVLPAILAVCLAAYYPEFAQMPGDYAYLGMIPVGLDAWGINMSFGLNGISLPLFVLAAWVGLAAGLYAIQGPAEEKGTYLMLLLLMFSGLLGTFASTNLFFFFFFHEVALVPTFIMIGRWGGAGRRAAAMELTIYLTAGAMLTLVGLIALYIQASPFMPTFDMRALGQFFAILPSGEYSQWLIFGLLMVGMGVLVSLFPFHTWAPRGYAAAPTSVAMMHAGVLKKFGLYGLIQIAVPMLPAGAALWAPWLMLLALGNVLYIGWVTVAQRDLKLMLGYSSVMHMGYAFLGIATLSTLGIGGALILMVGHGLTVALLFLLATSTYKRTGTYNMTEMGGLCKEAPILAAFFVAASLASLGLPGFLNFWGELSIFIALWDYSPVIAAFTILGVVISAIYGLRAVARIFFGEKPARQTQPIIDLSWGERWPALLLLVALLVLGFWPRPLIDQVNAGLSVNRAEPLMWAHPQIEPAPSFSEALPEAE